LSRISLPGHQNIKGYEDKTTFNPSFYTQVIKILAFKYKFFKFQNGSQDPAWIMADQPPSVRRSRPNSTCEMYGRVREQSPSLRDDIQTFSTIRRTHSPYRKPVDQPKGSAMLNTRRPPLPRKYQPADRPPIPPRSDCADEINTSAISDNNMWQCMHTGDEANLTITPEVRTPRCLEILTLPDFNQEQKNMGKWSSSYHDKVNF
jgi:hypothetical protein